MSFDLTENTIFWFLQLVALFAAFGLGHYVTRYVIYYLLPQSWKDVSVYISFTLIWMFMSFLFVFPLGYLIRYLSLSFGLVDA